MSCAPRPPSTCRLPSELSPLSVGVVTVGCLGGGRAGVCWQQQQHGCVSGVRRWCACWGLCKWREGVNIGTWPVTGARVCLSRAETGNLGGPGINWGSWRRGYQLLVASFNHACAWQQGCVHQLSFSHGVSLLFGQRRAHGAWCWFVYCCASFDTHTHSRSQARDTACRLGPVSVCWQHTQW